jgi:hypothetical protein
VRYRIASIIVALCALFGADASPSDAGDAADSREPVQRTDTEKAFVLEQMRLF